MEQLQLLEEQRLLIYIYKEVYFQVSVIQTFTSGVTPFRFTVNLPRPVSDTLGRKHEGPREGFVTFDEAKAAGETMGVSLIDGFSSIS